MNYEEKYKHMKVVRNGTGIAVVSINRPDIMNSVPLDVHWDVEHIWADLAEDDEINVIVFTGEGKYFSAGGNIKGQVERWGTPVHKAHIASVADRAKRMITGILDCSKPIVGAIQGDAMGLGATLAVLCDISVMSETARIGDSHVKVGLVAGDGGPVIWPLVVGVNQAKNFLMRGLTVKGDEAARLGIVTYAFPQEQVMAEAMKIAEELNALPPLAVRWTKVATNLIVKRQFDAVMDAAIAYEALSLASEDHLEAAKAFLEKRKGVYKGL
jgi:enoyl-CoA hydratase/carnithine racemase